MLSVSDTLKRWRHARFVQHRTAERRQGIRDALRTASKDCVLLVGDSHAELIGAPDFEGRRCLNLGVGGSTAADCAKQLASLDAPIRSAAAILFIGTNDILRCRHPERCRAAHRFQVEARRILGILDAWSETVFVAAVPPIGAAAKSRDPAAVASFSDRLEALCSESGHTFFDPFAAMRSGETGLAQSALHPDGVHMADYPTLAAEVVRIVAPQVGSRVPMPGTVATTSISIERSHFAGWCGPNRSFSTDRLRA